MNKDQQQALAQALRKISVATHEAAEALRGVTEISDEDYGWIPWHGGEMPVPEGTKVDVKHRDGEVFEAVLAGTGVANNWRHWSGSCGSEIIAYRLAEPRQDEPPKDYRDGPVAAAWLGPNTRQFKRGNVYRISGSKISSEDGVWIEFLGIAGGWQLLYPGKVYAQAPENAEGNITPFWCYETIEDKLGGGFNFYNNNGHLCYGVWQQSAHLNYGDWTCIIPEEL